MTVGNVEFSRHSAFGREKCQLRPCSWLGLGRFYLQLIAAWFSDCNGHVWQRLMHRPRRQLFITEPHYWTLLITLVPVHYPLTPTVLLRVNDHPLSFRTNAPSLENFPSVIYICMPRP